LLKFLNWLYLPSHYCKEWIYFRALSEITFIFVCKDVTLYVFMKIFSSLEYSLQWIVFIARLCMRFCEFPYNFLYFIVNHLLFFAIFWFIQLFFSSFTFYGVFCSIVLFLNLHLQVIFEVFSINNRTVYWFFIVSLVRMNFNSQNIEKSFIRLRILLL